MKNLGTVRLETERLVLRKAEENDWEPMFRNWAYDGRVTKYLTWEPYKSAEDVKNGYHKYLMENRDKDDFYNWMIVLKETGEPIGGISVVRLREDIEEVEIGYCIGYPWWHQGIMTEAFGRVIRFFFEEVGVNRISSYHDPRNPNSGAVMKKCGMSYEGTMRQADRNTQGICDASLYAILKEDYFYKTY